MRPRVVADPAQREGLRHRIAQPQRGFAPDAIDEPVLQAGQRGPAAHLRHGVQGGIAKVGQGAFGQRIAGQADEEAGRRGALQRKDQIAGAARGEAFDHLRAGAQGEAVGRAHPAVGFGVGEQHHPVAQLFGVGDQKPFAPGSGDLGPGQAGAAFAKVEDVDPQVTRRGRNFRKFRIEALEGFGAISLKKSCPRKDLAQVCVGVVAMRDRGRQRHGEGRVERPGLFDRQGRAARAQVRPHRPFGRLHDAGGRPVHLVLLPAGVAGHVAVFNPGAIDRHAGNLRPPRQVALAAPGGVRAQKHRIPRRQPADHPAGGAVDMGEVRIAGGIDLHRDPVPPRLQRLCNVADVHRHRGWPGPFRPAPDEAAVDPQAIAAVGAEVQQRLWRHGLQHQIGTEVQVGLGQVERMRRADPAGAVRCLQDPAGRGLPHCSVPYCAASLLTSR